MKNISRMGPLALALVALLALAVPALAANPQFSQPAFYKAGPGPFEVITADFDEDGTLDLMTANRFGGEQPGTGDLSFLKGNPDGTFEPARQYEVSTSATDVIAEDFDEDGNLDVALTDPDSGPAGSPGSVVILLGDGTGTFERTPERADKTASGGVRPFELVAADFDDDGDKDIAVANGGGGTGGGTVGIVRNSGAGNFTFESALTPDPAQSVESLDVGEFNEDGDPDIVATLSDANSGDGDDAAIYLGATNRTFTPAAPPLVPVGDAPVHAYTADFDGDGNTDFATANNGSDDVSVALGNGDGTFDPAQEYDTEEGPYALTAADFDRDGDLDLAAANQFTRNGGGENNDKGTVSVLPGKGDGTFEDQVVRDTGDGPAGITSGLFNGDDLPDIATANYGAGGPERETDTVAVLLGEPSQCSDGTDNDGDGETDFPADLGCGSGSDNTENSTPPTLAISDATVTEGDTGTTNATFTVTRSGDTSGSSSVDYATQDGSATAPEDYTPTSNTLTFGPGETSKEIQVPVKGDTRDEPDENFRVDLSNPTGATISDGEGTGTITDDDPTPPPPEADLALDITDEPSRVSNGDTVRYTLTVTNNGDDTASDVEVEFEIPRGTEFLNNLPPRCEKISERVVRCELGDIADGASKSREIGVKVNRDRSFRVSGEATSSTADPDTTDNADTERTRVR